MRASRLRRVIGLASTLILAAMFVTQSFTVTRADATMPGRNGKIAFVRSGSIYTINPDGTGIRKLVSRAWAPAWSPDGTRIAFSRNHSGAFAIWTMNANGTGLRELLPGITGTVTWSPDGTQLAYSHLGLGADLWIANVDGSGSRLLATSPAWVSYITPAWSPDGTKIAFTSERYDESSWYDKIWVINTDGTGLRQVTSPSHGGASSPSWSPGGGQIAFSGLWNGADNVWAIRADGTGLRQLTHGHQYTWNGDPSWSPDGKLIAFESGRSGPYLKIWTIGSNGRGVHQVTWLAGVGDEDPDWQPIP